MAGSNGHGWLVGWLVGGIENQDGGYLFARGGCYIPFCPCPNVPNVPNVPNAVTCGAAGGADGRVAFAKADWGVKCPESAEGGGEPRGGTHNARVQRVWAVRRSPRAARRG